MTSLNYSDAQATDLPIIVGIYNSTIESRMVTADLQPVSVESRVAWFEQHNPGRRPLWMARNDNNETVGWVSFQDFYGRAAYNGTAEISIYLDPLHRGKGLGKQILQYSINNCKPLGIHTLLGYVFAHNEPSLKLFRRAGFKDWGHFPRIAVLDGIERSLIILGKRLYE